MKGNAAILFIFLLYSSVICCQPKFDADSVFQVISVPVSDSRVQNFIQQNINEWNKAYKSGDFTVYDGDGISLRIKNDTVYEINLYLRKNFYSSITRRNLPFGLPWGADIRDVEKKLGEPSFKYDGGLISYPYNETVTVYFFSEDGVEKPWLNTINIITTRDKQKLTNAGYLKNKKSEPFTGAVKPAIPSVANPPVISQTSAVTNDLCSVMKQLLADANQNFSSQKKIKEWTTGTWQLENKIPGAIFTELKNGVYKVRIKDNLPQGPEANKAMDEWRNKITACLPGYTFKESSLSVFSDNPDEVMNYSWSVKYGQPYVELQREVTSYNKANIFIIIKPK